MKIKPIITAQSGKLVKAHDSGKKGPGQEYPAFSLRYLSKDFCITACSKDAMASFAEKVKMLTQMSWLEITQLPRHGLGFEKIPRKKIRGGIPTHVTPDVEYFWAFRFHGKAPMVGYKNGETFFVLWFDEKFRLYDHGT